MEKTLINKKDNGDITVVMLSTKDTKVGHPLNMGGSMSTLYKRCVTYFIIFSNNKSLHNIYKTNWKCSPQKCEILCLRTRCYFSFFAYYNNPTTTPNVFLNGLKHIVNKLFLWKTKNGPSLDKI